MNNFLKPIQRFLIPPDLLADEHTAHLVRSLVAMALLGLFVTVLYSLLWAVIMPQHSERLMFSLIALLACVAPLVLIRMRRVQLANLSFLGGVWLLVTVATPSAGGTRAPFFGLYTLIVMTAAFYSGWQIAFRFAALSIAAGLVTVFLDSQGQISAPLATPLSAWLTQTIIMILLTGAAYFAIRRTNQTLRRVRHELNEREKLETALRESEERFRLISSVTSDYTFSSRFNAQGELEHLLLTGAFEAITGYTPEEYVAVGGWRARLHPDDVAQDEHDMASLHDNKRVVTEVRVFSKSGEIRWVRVYADPVWDAEHNRLLSINGAVQDITDRKRAEVALRESEERYRGAISAAGLVPYVLDYRSQRFTFIGADVMKLTGYSATDITPLLLTTNIQEEYAWKSPGNLSSDETRSLILSGVPMEWHNDYRLRTRNGESRWISDTSVPITDESGKAIGAIGIMQDITERKQVEEKVRALNADLEQKAAQLSTLNDIAHDISLLTDLKSALRRILEKLKDTLPLDLFFIALFNAAGDQVEFPIIYDMEQFWDETQGTINRPGLMAQVFDSGIPILKNRTQAEIEERIAVSMLQGDRIGNTNRISASIMMVPLKLAREIIGVISVQSYTRDVYEQKHLDLLQAAAYQIAIAVDNARLYDSLNTELIQRKQAEEALRSREALLRALLDATTDVAFLMSPDGSFLTLNKTLAELRGKSVEELIGQNALDVLNPALRQERYQHFHEAIQTGKPTRWQDVNQTTFWDNSIYPVLSPAGEVEAFAVYGRNITEQKRLEAELQRYNTQLEQIIEERTAQLRSAKEQIEVILNNTSDAVALAQPNGDVQTINPAFTATFGESVSQSIEHILSNIAADDQIMSVGQALMNVIWDNEHQRVEAQITSQDGRDRDLDLAFIPVQLSGKLQEQGFLVSAHDITHMKEIERFKARFVADALHDMATPITGLMTRLYLLKRAPAKLEEHVRALENQVEHLRDLLMDLRTLSQIDRGHLALNREPYPVADSLRRVFDTYEPVAISKQQTLTLTMNSALPEMLLDHRQFERALVNLVSNAINYTLEGKSIAIEAALTDDQLVIAVADEGMGIRPDDLPHVFERFFRADEARQTQSTGTGLGLAIVKDIIELHGGRAEVESTLGVGSIFRIILPLTT